MKDTKVKWAIDESVTPIAQKHCRVSFHLCDKIDSELKRLFDTGIIERVNDTSEWVSPVVIVPKRNSDEIRLCVDMTQANKAFKQVRHVIPTLDELCYDLNGAKVFSRLDSNKGFHQLVVR